MTPASGIFRARTAAIGAANPYRAALRSLLADGCPRRLAAQIARKICEGN